MWSRELPSPEVVYSFFMDRRPLRLLGLFEQRPHFRDFKGATCGATPAFDTIRMNETFAVISALVWFEPIIYKGDCLKAAH